MTFVAELEPRELWGHFDRILTIPRGSGNEAGMRAFVAEIAERNGLAHRSDAVGNLVVTKPGAAGRESAPATILQAHLDMVNEKNSGTVHDFDRDPIRPVRGGEFLRADGTTLGSDNGIGVAAMLALMDARNVAHGPLELLFTIDEERGLTGAAQLDGALLQGRRLINLDSEEEGTLTVGCAGGADSRFYFPVQAETPAPGLVALDVELSGGKGGHSGVDIHLQRGNAIKLLARAIHAAALEVPLSLASLKAGDKTNAIPREAFASILVNENDVSRATGLLEAELAAIRDEYRPAEPGLQWTIARAASSERAWSRALGAKILDLLVALPHGVLAMSYDIPGLVETSTNLARVREQNGEVEIFHSNRSSVASAMVATRRRMRALGALAGARVEEGAGYPGWKPDLSSPLLAVTKKLHAEVLGYEAHVGAIHAGLECGIIGEKVPGMDMISFGPTINFPHSPDERVEIATVGRFYRLLTRTLEALAS